MLTMNLQIFAHKNIAASDEEREVFRELRKMELMMKVQVVPTEKAED